MCSWTSTCFMCTNNCNCSLVNDRIVTQVEYLLPEITVIKLGVPLRICCSCEKNLHTFNEFKHACVANSLRLEARIKKAQSNRSSSAQVSSSPKTQPVTHSCSRKNESTTIGTNNIVEVISIKEEPREETSFDREYYNNVLESLTKAESAVDNNVTCSKNIQLVSKYGNGEKNAIPGTSDQNFEEIYIKPEVIEDGSMDFEDCDDLDDSNINSNEDNLIAVDHNMSKSGNTSSFYVVEDSEMSCTSPEIIETTKTVDFDLLPVKSSSIYKANYDKFIKWCESKNVESYSESVMLAYFSDLISTQKIKTSSIWPQYSMIKSLLNIEHGIDISKYSELRAYMKKLNEGYVPKKAKAFTKKEFERFVFEAPDDKYLAMKVVLIIGISGGCRCDELVKMKIEHIEDLGSLLHIKVPDSKTKKVRSFTVVGEKCLNFYRKYVSLRPLGLNCSRLFVKYTNGKCQRSVMGVHTIGNVCKAVASYLNLADSNEYTGHCLRRTSATLLVNGGSLESMQI